MVEMFQHHQTKFEEVFTFSVPMLDDRRGGFTKYFSNLSRPLLDNFTIREIFATTSKQNVIRGMHFQLPPLPQSKYLFVLSGEVLEVVIDLRNDSPSYGETYSTRMEAVTSRVNNPNPTGIFVPAGFAHGYLVTSEHATVVYCADFDFDSQLDAGVAWDSIDFDWPIKSPIISDKDLVLPKIGDFSSPFVKKV